MLCQLKSLCGRQAAGFDPAMRISTSRFALASQSGLVATFADPDGNYCQLVQLRS